MGNRRSDAPRKGGLHPWGTDSDKIRDSLAQYILRQVLSTMEFCLLIRLSPRYTGYGKNEQ